MSCGLAVVLLAELASLPGQRKALARQAGLQPSTPSDW